ncbi:hypothetical protein [Lysinibacillus xylanilyticus]|uniref:Uncharacterized protein n=1 Tax=Lysinibacillus xylanilyticus TaxID=582475 RepID=A0A2M9PXK5_9BACI|nr:hypothetical protein [Lysinibacillus xylanilyticus]PJO40547.1 hypothetical protein CWD94_27570 [Lysinibacillus xylanilyticus]
MGKKRTISHEEKKIQVVLQIKRNTNEKLSNYANDNDVSKSEVVQQLLEEFLEKDEKPYC